MKNEPVEIEYDFLNSEIAFEEGYIKLNDEKLPLSSISKLGLEFQLYKKFFQKKVLKIFLNEHREVRIIYLVQKIKGKKFEEDADKISVFTTQLFEKASNRPFYVKPYIKIFVKILIGFTILMILCLLALFTYLFLYQSHRFDYDNIKNINWFVINLSVLTALIGFGTIWSERNRYRKSFTLNSENYKKEICDFFLK